MANFLSKLFSAGASTLVEAVGDAIDKNVTSDEERLEKENEMAKASMNYDIEMGKLGLEETQAFLADTASARLEQSRVQESEHASWLSKNVHPILALVIISLTFILFYWVVVGNLEIEGKNKDIIIYILGALSTIATQVVAYFFGSSHGSAEKNKTLAGFKK